MLTNNKAVIAVALVVILILAIIVKTTFFNKWAAYNKIDIENRSVHVRTTTNDIVLYEIPGNAPLIERTKSDKIREGFSAGTTSYKEKGGEVIYVGIPKGDYSLEVETVSGNITGAMNASEVELSTVSGNIKVEHLTAKEVELTTTSGDIKVNELETEEIDTKTVSGDVVIDDYLAKDGNFKSVSGDITLQTSIESFTYSSTSVSGETISDIPFTENSAHTLKANTVSGDVMIKRLI